MILCVDLDDTLASSGKTIINYAIKFNKEVLKRNTKVRKINDCYDYYYFAKMLDWDKNTVISFFDYWYPYYLESIKVKYGTRKYLKLLHDFGITIYIVTSRRETSNNIVKNITLKWLKKNKLYYDKLYINVKNKAKLLKKIKPDFYIDDSLKNCDSIHSILSDTKVFLMNTDYNKGIVTHYKRINSIKDFYNIIKEGEQN